MGEGSWPTAPCGRAGALASTVAWDIAQPERKSWKVRGFSQQRRKMELVLISLSTHCSQAQMGNLEVAVPRVAAGVGSGSLPFGSVLWCCWLPGCGQKVALMVAWGWIKSGRGEESLIDANKYKGPSSSVQGPRRQESCPLRQELQTGREATA